MSPRGRPGVVVRSAIIEVVDGADRAAVVLERLDAIGRAVAADGRSLAVIGLGSVGLERERIDRWSDIDVFVVTRDGCAAELLGDLSWLAGAAPIAFAYRNTRDGYKVLFDDGVLCENAVVDVSVLPRIPAAAGRWVWRADDAPDWLVAARVPGADPFAGSVEWQVGEVLTCLHSGLSRFGRGERASAMMLVQQHAVDHLLALVELVSASVEGGDPFSVRRRVEVRRPSFVAALPSWMQGYDRTPESAAAILASLRSLVEVPAAMAAAVEDLLAEVV